MGTARIDSRRRLVFSAFAVDHSYKDPTAAVFRISPAQAAKVLVAEGQVIGEFETIHALEQTGFYVMRCWDMDAEGRLIFADPSNGYRVIIGHPADGESKTVVLAARPGDEESLRRLAKSTGWTKGGYPRITNLYWLDEGRFLVMPGAEARELVPSMLGVYEVFDPAGRSLGRRPLRCDFDPKQDSDYIRNGLLIVIKGGKSANDAVYAQMAAMLGIKGDAADSNSQGLADEIRVDVYDLNRHYAAIATGLR